MSFGKFGGVKIIYKLADTLNDWLCYPPLQEEDQSLAPEQSSSQFQFTPAQQQPGGFSFTWPRPSQWPAPPSWFMFYRLHPLTNVVIATSCIVLLSSSLIAVSYTFVQSWIIIIYNVYFKIIIIMH